MMSEYKNISQIETGTESTHYMRPFDYARAIALTEFLRQLEDKHGDNFKLKTASPKFIYYITNKGKDEMEKTRAFAIGMWAEWVIGETHYYMQMNNNPFFDAYLIRSWRIGNNMLRSEYGSGMNEELYSDARWNAEPATIMLLVKNFHRAFNAANKRQPETYTKEIPAYNRKEKQTLYKN
jgi:hypothetical protein